MGVEDVRQVTDQTSGIQCRKRKSSQMLVGCIKYTRNRRSWVGNAAAKDEKHSSLRGVAVGFISH